MPHPPEIKACCFNVNDAEKKVLWQVTYSCPFNCQHCCIGDKTKLKDLSLEKNKQIVDRLKILGFSKIIFSGGEPLLYKDFLALAEYVQSLGFRLTLTTAGMANEDILSKLVNLNFDNITFGVDSLDNSKQDFFRGQGGALEKVLYSASYLKKMGKKITFRVVVTRLNYKDLDSMINFFLSNDFNVSVGRLLPVGNAIHSAAYFLLDPEEEKLVKDVLTKWREQIEVDGFNFGGGAGLSRCLAGKQLVSVLPDGRMSPCPLMKDLDHRLAKEWDNSLPDWSDELNSGPWLMKQNAEKTCVECSAREYCGKGCQAAAIAFNLGYDVLCKTEPVNRRKTEYVASAFIFNPSHDKLLFIQRVKEPLVGQWLPPGGHVEESESPDATAIREAREETGLDAFFESSVAVDIQIDERVKKIALPHIIQREFIDYRHDHIDLMYILFALADGPLKVQGNQIAMWMSAEAIGKMPMPGNVRQTALDLLEKYKK